MVILGRETEVTLAALGVGVLLGAAIVVALVYVWTWWEAQKETA